MDLGARQREFSHALALLILHAESLGFGVSVREVGRNIETQRKNVAEGRSKTLDSRHLDFLAADLVLYKDGRVITSGEEFRALGEYWESIGGRWGGRFGFEDQPKEVQSVKLGWDSPHFEFRKCGPATPSAA